MGELILVFGLFLTLFTISKCDYPYSFDVNNRDSLQVYNRDGDIGSSGLVALATNPYQVAILGRLPSDSDVLDGLRFICGGSLIAPQWVLTSAQCVESPNLKIMLGVTNIRVFEPFHVSFDVTPDNVTVHPDYQKGVFENDIALIKMPAPVEYSQNIQPIALADKSDETYENATVFVSGWGRSNSFIPVSDFLRQSTVKVISNEQCQVQYRFPLIRISNDHLCTWDGDWFSETTSCPRDPGSPLIYFNSILGRSEQIGIASKIPFDCTGKPTVFTKISDFRNWIQNVMDVDCPTEEPTTPTTTFSPVTTEEPTTPTTTIFTVTTEEPTTPTTPIVTVTTEEPTTVEPTTVEPTTQETTTPWWYPWDYPDYPDYIHTIDN